MFYCKSLILVSSILMISVPELHGKVNKYCSICENHTMCKYQTVGPDCEDIGGYGVTTHEKNEIVDVHNWYRRVVAGGHETAGSGGPQPKGANMMKLHWDEDLAQVAQRWADQCRLEHDACRDDARWKVGQNIYWKWKYPKHNVNWTEAITSWYNEVTLFNPKDVKSYRFDAGTGHYTQMLWHDTHLVGCGRRDYGYNKLYVCNYGPTGNWIGEPMYSVGEPCSKCPTGTTCNDYLCDFLPLGTVNTEQKLIASKETSAQNSEEISQKPDAANSPKPSKEGAVKPISETSTLPSTQNCQKTDDSNAPKPSKQVTVGPKPILPIKNNTTATTTERPKLEQVDDNIVLDQETNSAIEEIKIKIKTLLKKAIKKAIRNVNFH